LTVVRLKDCRKRRRTFSFRYQNCYLVYSEFPFSSWLDSPSGTRPHSCRGFTITLRHITLGRTPLEVWSVRRRNIHWQRTHIHTHTRQQSMPQAEFELAIPATERPQTHALNRAATWIGQKFTERQRNQQDRSIRV